MDISADSIIKHAADNNITLKHGIPANPDDNMMCAASVLLHMFIGEEVRTFDMWYGKYDNKRIPFTKKQVRALEVGFEGYEYEYHLYEFDPFDGNYVPGAETVEQKLFGVGQRLRAMIKHPEVV